MTRLAIITGLAHADMCIRFGDCRTLGEALTAAFGQGSGAYRSALRYCAAADASLRSEDMEVDALSILTEARYLAMRDAGAWAEITPSDLEEGRTVILAPSAATPDRSSNPSSDLD